jgi:hypothetical protein
VTIDLFLRESGHGFMDPEKKPGILECKHTYVLEEQTNALPLRFTSYGVVPKI